MKNNLLVILISFFTLTLFFNFSRVEAQESTASNAATYEQKSIDYTLPYPGILPDSRFYFFKVARDRVISFLISDPLKKAEFDLLEADKRLAAGNALFLKNKKDLAITTILKGQNYFEEGIGKIDEANKQGLNTFDYSRKFFLSAQKQVEVLKGLQKNSGDITPVLKRALDIEKRAKSLI